MDAKQIIALRKQAERAVAEMPDGDLKVKAFEVILNHLLGGPATQKVQSESSHPAARVPRSASARKEASPAKSISGRILVLRDEGFFKNQRTIAEVREELRAHGWHYPLTTLSDRLQALVQQRKLRRERATQGNKKVWKYSNP
jgi:hypothetical protein